MKLSEIKDISGKNISPNEIVGHHAALAKHLGVSPEELNKMSEDEIEYILRDVGKHDFAPDSHYNASELKKGAKVEQEHTESELVAKLIAKDHLDEIPDYYTRLEKMEKDALSEKYPKSIEQYSKEYQECIDQYAKNGYGHR